MDWKGGPPEPGKWGRKKKQFFGRPVPAVLEFLPPSQENPSSPSPFSPRPPPPPPPRQFKQSPGKDEKMKRGRRKRAPPPPPQSSPKRSSYRKKEKVEEKFLDPWLASRFPLLFTGSDRSVLWFRVRTIDRLLYLFLTFKLVSFSFLSFSYLLLACNWRNNCMFCIFFSLQVFDPSIFGLTCTHEN